MKLNEKIYTCRKRAGLSQEALADKLGVSRQAVSKWETGEAEPEIGKLRLLAKEFGVTADWLLSEEEPEDEKAPGWTVRDAAPDPGRGSDWVDTLPGALGRLCRRFGWLAGVYIALSGLGITIVGVIARVMFGMMNRATDGMFGGTTISGLPTGVSASDIIGQLPGFDSGFQTVSRIPLIFSGIIIALGVILMIVGIVLAVVLKKKLSNSEK